MDGQALVQKGKKCLILARDIQDDIVRGKLISSSALSELQCYGKQLESAAEGSAQNAERTAKECKSMIEQHQLEESKLAVQEQELNCRLSEVNARLRTQQAILNDTKKRVSDANEELRRAKCKLAEAEKVKAISGMTGSIVGTVLGTILLGPLGGILGSSLGVGIGQLVCDVESANATVHRCQQECEIADLEVDRTKLVVTSIETQINAISTEIAQKKQECANFHNKATEMKEITVFYQKLAYMASMFKQVCEHGVDRTALLQKLVATAEERQTECTFWQCRGSLRVTMNCFEAWEAIESYNASDLSADHPLHCTNN
eukprot:Em0002g1088a